MKSINETSLGWVFCSSPCASLVSIQSDNREFPYAQHITSSDDWAHENLHENICVCMCVCTCVLLVCFLPRGPKELYAERKSRPSRRISMLYFVLLIALQLPVCIQLSWRACVSAWLISCLRHIKPMDDWMDEDGQPNFHKRRILICFLVNVCARNRNEP